MGQRLNIQILENDEVIANAYFHWSGYTSSALSLTNAILENMYTMEKEVEEERVLYAIRLLESTGALLKEDELELAKKSYEDEEFQVAASRADGLISISAEGIEQTVNLEEGRVEIHIDKETVDFTVLYISDKENYLRYSETTEEEYQAKPIVAYNYNENEIPFDEFKEFASTLLEFIKNQVYVIRIQNDEVITFIE